MADPRISATADHRGASIPASDLLAELCGEIAGAVKRAWGRGPVKTTAHWAGSDTLVVLMHDGHTDRERALRAGGQIQPLFEGRRLLLELLQDELSAIVHRTTGREVATVLSATRLDPDLTAEIFLLSRAPGAWPEPSITHRAQQARDVSREQLDAAQALHAQSRQAQRNNA